LASAKLAAPWAESRMLMALPTRSATHPVSARTRARVMTSGGAVGGGIVDVGRGPVGVQVGMRGCSSLTRATRFDARDLGRRPIGHAGHGTLLGRFDGQ
jgi:hypothetical protein